MSLMSKLEEKKRVPSLPAPETKAIKKHDLLELTPSKTQRSTPAQKTPSPEALQKTSAPQRPRNTKLEIKLHNYLVEELKRSPELSQEQLRERIPRLAEPFFETEGDRLPFEQKTELLQVVTDDLVAYGPITSFLDDPLITEVMVNGPDAIYVERNGKLYETEAYFRNDEHVLQIIEKIIAPIGRRIDESVPMVDARLPDGSRVNAIIPPLSLVGPCITIRKFSKDPFTIDDLIEYGTLNKDMAEFMNYCVQSKLNIFISGGTGSGKTSTLNVLSSFIGNTERIVTIEDSAELKLSQRHVISCETRPPNLEGKGAIEIRDLVRNSLRMRPDRIVVGEVRGPEALDMLQAMNTGHDGSLSTGHANSPRDLLSRLETMVLMAGMDLPVRAIREQIAGALDMIVHQSRMRDGSRKITHITEVLGMEGDVIVLQDLFVFKQTGVNEDEQVTGHFVSTGIRPHFSEALSANGYDLPTDWFHGEWSE